MSGFSSIFVRDEAVLLRKRRQLLVLINVGEMFFFKGQSSVFAYGIQILACIWRMVDSITQACSQDMLLVQIVTSSEEDHCSFLK